MASPDIDYADVQGTILRGYRVDLARHFILQITDVAAARTFIGNLANGTGGVPKVTTAARWTSKPDCFVNIGFTAPGLKALGVTDDQMAHYDSAFRAGAADPAQAADVGDIGNSAPDKWLGGIEVWQNAHAVLSLWVHEDPAVLDRVTAQLRAAFAAGCKELLFHDGKALPDNQVHFGYRDSISQPTVQGAPERKHSIPDDQPEVPTGEFLLGYPNASGGTYTVQPAQLSTNSSYAAFRILDQDVVGFENFLTEFAPQGGVDPEMLAAKVCGRWRNGNPLELFPDGPGECLPPNQLNNFTYVSTDPATDDTLGLKCPIGSHLRRNNPRNAGVVGTDSTHHRIVRRAMPYGAAYDPKQPVDEPRGLIGYFINGSITNQFVFLQSQWDQASDFVKAASGPGGPTAGNAVFNISGEDVFLGISTAATSSFTLPALGQNGKNNKTIKGFGQMITTRGSAYVLLPSITGLNYLATGTSA